MASQVSASASRQGLPASRIMMADSSSRRLRIAAAASRMMRERSSGSRSRQAGKAAAAAAIASRASSALGILPAAGTFVAVTARANSSRCAACEKSRKDSLIIGTPSPSPSTAGVR